MAPKVQAAGDFKKGTGNRIVIGLLNQIEALLAERNSSAVPFIEQMLLVRFQLSSGFEYFNTRQRID